MKHAAIMSFLWLSALAPLTAGAQSASEQESKVIASITGCMLSGLPSDWREAEMNVILPAPGGDGGQVSYLFVRRLGGGAWEEFVPCDVRRPAEALADLRKLQTPERAAWKSARLQIYPDGRFELKYDYPKAP